MTPSHATSPPGIPVADLVDDEAVVSAALAWLRCPRSLLFEGFAHAEAFEADLATRDLAGGWPSAPKYLLLDVRRPGSSGLVLFDRLVARGLTGALPLIFLTGHGDVATALGAVMRGALDFVEKPFSDNALVDRVVQVLANKLIADEPAISVRTLEVPGARRFDKVAVRSAAALAHPLREQPL